jgi:hypothetical protein
MKARNALGNEYSGTIGKSKTAVKRNGSNFERLWVMPYDPKTPKQMRMRKMFANAHDAWIALPQEKRNEYNERARNMKMTGYNLFVKEYVARMRYS